MDNQLQIFSLNNFTLASGIEMAEIKLAFHTYGTLNALKNNVIVFPTYFTGDDRCNEPFFGDGRALDPQKYFIIVPSLLGNGASSSPSNTPAPFNGPNFPNITLYDNVRMQYQMLRYKFGIEQIALVLGWSMGGCQTYHWAAQYPEMVQRMLPFCASAKTSVHNFVFLEGVKAALQADASWQNGQYSIPPEKGLRAFARVYAGWAYSQAFFRNAEYSNYGYSDIEAFLLSWEDDHLTWDANNLLAKIWSWQHADLAPKNNLHQALAKISAKSILMPCSTDLYFTVADNQLEAASIPNCELRVFRSSMGHCAASPCRPDPHFMQFLDKAITDLLRQ